ncbi:MAG: tetratricopeptide repeat protein [Myxococcaceae bacterium]
MKKLTIILSLALFVSSTAFAQADIGAYNRALSSFNSGDFDSAAQAFYELAESSTDQDIRTKSEYYLAQALAKKGLPFAAFIQYATILKAGKAHPYYLKSVEGLVNVQQALQDQDLIPNLLNNNYNDEWATLPQETLNRINYLIGTIDQRKAKFDEAQGFLEAVTPSSAVYPKAQYLLGIVLGDPRYPGGAKPEDAVKAFENVQKSIAPNYEDLQQMKYLATLATGRMFYGLGQFEKSSQAYESIPRFSRYWDQALFENGFARFQGEDFGGAMGSLQALHAPQFSGAFQPESWILKATVYYFSCLYDESKTALAAFDELYLPMQDKLKPIVEGEDKGFDYYFKLIAGDNTNDAVPQPVYIWVKSNERLLSSFNVLREIDAEKEAIATNSAWKTSKISRDLVSYLDQNRSTLVQVAGSRAKARLTEAYRNIKTFNDQAEIIRFETAKAEKELAEAGIDQQKLLAEKPLFRPKMPAENWNYWKFQGEFWRDEIGYYQYTLKKGCPATVEQ